MSVASEHQQQGNSMRYPDCHRSSERCETSGFSWDSTTQQKALFDISNRDHRYTPAYVRCGTDFEYLSRELADMKQYMAEHPPENMYEKQAWEVAERMAVLAEKQSNESGWHATP